MRFKDSLAKFGDLAQDSKDSREFIESKKTKKTKKTKDSAESKNIKDSIDSTESTESTESTRFLDAKDSKDSTDSATLTHINSQNHPTMVDVSQKNETSRTAIASGNITMNAAAYEAFSNNSGKKGPVADTAIVAAIMGTKKTSEIIPMCHTLCLNKVDCKISRDDKSRTITLEVSVKCEGKTGVEMEALSGVSIGLLTIYDMLKALDKSMIISDISLLHKSGGKSGEYNKTRIKP